MRLILYVHQSPFHTRENISSLFHSDNKNVFHLLEWGDMHSRINTIPTRLQSAVHEYKYNFTFTTL